MTTQTNGTAMLLTAQQSPGVPALVAAYVIGATLWAPSLVVMFGFSARVGAWFVPGLPVVGAAQMLVVMWVLRFALYVLGGRGGWDYGYGINGVIVNRGLSLSEKMYRIAKDWFGILLILVWLSFSVGALGAVLGGG